MTVQSLYERLGIPEQHDTHVIAWHWYVKFESHKEFQIDFYDDGEDIIEVFELRR